MAQMTLKRAQVIELLEYCRRHGKTQFYIAKDQGAYLGQNDGTSSNCLFYFKGCNPKTDDDWYENARNIFGGDDFGEMLPLDMLESLEKDPNADKLRIILTAASVTVQLLTKPMSERTPKPAAPAAKSAPAMTFTADDLKQMSISALAHIIRKNWPKPYFGAVPYIDAMMTMLTIDDKYGEESGASIVAYGVSNMQTWRGETARLVKAELNRRLKEASK